MKSVTYYFKSIHIFPIFQYLSRLHAKSFLYFYEKRGTYIICLYPEESRMMFILASVNKICFVPTILLYWLLKYNYCYIQQTLICVYVTFINVEKNLFLIQYFLVKSWPLPVYHLFWITKCCYVASASYEVI